VGVGRGGSRVRADPCKVIENQYHFSRP